MCFSLTVVESHSSLSIDYAPATALGTGDAAENKQAKYLPLCSMEAMLLGEGKQTKN